jgi:hypothetical protein
LRLRLDAGLDGIVCNFPELPTPETIELASRALHAAAG